MRYIPKIIASSLLFFASVGAEEETTHDITVQIKINCPTSDEFSEFVKSIPQAGYHSESFEEWKEAFVANMSRLIALVESKQIYSSTWGVDAVEHVAQDDELDGE